MKMDQIRRSVVLLRSRYYGLMEWDSLLQRNHIKRLSDMGFAAFSSSAATERSAIAKSSKREMLCAGGNNFHHGWQHSKESIVGLHSHFQLMRGACPSNPRFARLFASNASKQTDKTASEV